MTKSFASSLELSLEATSVWNPGMAFIGMELSAALRELLLVRLGVVARNGLNLACG